MRAERRLAGRLRAALACPLTAALLLAGCGAGGGRGPGWDVLLIVVDTLRADHLGLYGYQRPTSPFLDRLGRQSVVFTHSRAQAGCTLPSVFSLLTSRYGIHFLVGEHPKLIPPAVAPLAEILHQRGYATAAVSASQVVRNTPSKINKLGGYGRGFDAFDETCEDSDAACVNRRAFALLDAMERPSFLYLHYMEPHAPYRPPPEHHRRFAGDGGDLPRWVRRGNPVTIQQRLYRGKDNTFTAADVDYLRALYDEEISYLDGQLAALLNGLARRGRLERTLIVFTADHGEEFLEHGEFSHCRDIAYDTVLATPLVMRIPGVAPARRQAPVQNLDIVPTVLDYLGIDRQALGLEGRSLRPLIERDRPVDRYLFAGQGKMRTVSDGRYKLLLDLRSGERRLFDLDADPGETADLAAEQPQVAAELAAVLSHWIETLEGEVGAPTSLDAAEELRKELEAVGYL
jgi:arylsulfatase A-like enzyme